MANPLPGAGAIAGAGPAKTRLAAELRAAETRLPAKKLSGEPSRQLVPPIDVRYASLHGTSSNRGTLDIDRIELVR